MKEAKNAADKSENLFYSHAFKESKQPMAIVDMESEQYKYVNQAFLDFFEYNEEEVIGKTYHEINLLNNPGDSQKILTDLHETGHLIEYPLVLKTRTGQLKYTILNMHTFVIDGRLYRFSVVDDKTEVFNQELEYNQLDRKNQFIVESFNSILNSTYHMIWTVDPYRHGILHFNEATKEYFKRKKIEVARGMTPEELLLKAENAAYWHSLYEKAATEGKITINYEPEIGTISMILTISPMYVNGELAGISVFSENISELNRYKNELEQSNANLRLLFNQAISTIAKMVELKDSYTSAHQKRVCALAIAIAEEMQLEPQQIEYLSTAALLHDIGKILVPMDILNKPGKISEFEYRILQEHPKGAYEILENIDFEPIIKDIILQHHEMIDGSGYPNKLFGDQICLEARILTVADIVEAMSTHRPYRPSLGIDAALEEISRFKGIQLDNKVVDTCISLFKEKSFRFNEY